MKRADNTTIPNAAAQLTVLTSEYPKDLTKQILLDKDGNMIKQPSANLSKGTAELVSIQSMQEFSELLQSLETNQALIYGVPSGALSQAKVVTKKAFGALEDTEGVITRSNDHFEWPAGPGIMMFDYDPDGEALGQEAVLQLLYDVCPEIKNVDHLWWTSSSSNITNEETGEQLTSVSGQRIYVMVEDARDIPRAAKVLEDTLWREGHGYFKVTQAGSMLERVPFDMSIYQPSRLDFAAGASTTAPLNQDRGLPELIKGTNNVLDTDVLLLELDKTDQTLMEAMKHAQKSVAMIDAEKAKAQYLATMSETLKANDNYLTDEMIPDVIESAVVKGKLPPYWPLHVWTGEELAEVTVETVLNNKFDYHELLCLDPIEPDYDDGRLVSKLYLDQKDPVAYSFARGGRSFFLNDYVPEIFLPGQLSYAVDECLDILEHKGAAYCYGGSLAQPIAGKLCSGQLIPDIILS